MGNIVATIPHKDVIITKKTIDYKYSCLINKNIYNLSV